MTSSVALLHPTFWPETRRGAERLIRDLAVDLSKLGLSPSVITSRNGPAGVSVESGVPVRFVHRAGRNPLRRLGYREHLTHLPGLRRALAAADPEVVHSFYPTDALLASGWAQPERISVFTVTGIPRRDVIEGRPFRKGMWKRAASRSDAVVALSQAAKRELGWLEADIRVISPGVDLGRFTPGPARSRSPMIFCPAAADDPRKQVGRLIAAFERLRQRKPDARLVLDASASDLPGADGPGIELRCLDRDAELEAAYRAAWVTALPSRREAFGLVLAESLACGTPVVGSADAGMEEVLGEADVGALVPADSDESLVESLSSLLGSSPDDELAGRCVARARELSSLESARRYRALYEDLGAELPAEPRIS